jgi:hypothetical protein
LGFQDAPSLRLTKQIYTMYLNMFSERGKEFGTDGANNLSAGEGNRASQTVHQTEHLLMSYLGLNASHLPN